MLFLFLPSSNIFETNQVFSLFELLLIYLNFMQTLPNLNFSYQPLPSQPLRIVAMGDSLVYGYGDTEGGGWVERLKRHCMSQEKNQDHVLYNLGIRGDRTAQVKKRLSQEFRLRGEVRNRYPDVIILSVGVNDTPRLGHSQGRNQTSHEEFTRDINTLLDQAQELAEVLFIGMIPVDESKMPFLNSFYFNLVDQYHYKEITRQACEVRKIPYLDVFDIWMSRGENWRKSQMSEDGLHPNIRGYETLYREIIEWQPLKYRL